MELNTQQKLAIETSQPRVLVASGAGAGKTAVLLERVKFLLSQKVEPTSICAITFTNMAAEELKTRIGTQGDGVFFGTIHGLANQILRRNNIDTSKLLEEENFDELFKLIHKKKIYIPHYSHLLVDEFQDISDKEYSFFKDLKPDNFFYCGDSQQSIFSFRGGNKDIFESLARDSKTTVYKLTNNYRSTQEIIKFGEDFLNNCREPLYRIHNITEKTGSTPTVLLANKNKTSYDILLDLIDTEIKGDYKNWFILCRTNAEVDLVMWSLNKKGIPNVTFKKSLIDLSKLKEITEENSIKVLTIHSAKGLENENVIVYGARNWSDEELRLNYVAATRAKNKLYWIIEQPKKKKSKSFHSVKTLSLNF